MLFRSGSEAARRQGGSGKESANGCNDAASGQGGSRRCGGGEKQQVRRRRDGEAAARRRRGGQKAARSREGGEEAVRRRRSVSGKERRGWRWRRTHVKLLKEAPLEEASALLEASTLMQRLC